MNIRILAATGLTLAMLAPVANAASEHVTGSNGRVDRASFARDHNLGSACRFGTWDSVTNLCKISNVPAKYQFNR